MLVAVDDSLAGLSDAELDTVVGLVHAVVRRDTAVLETTGFLNRRAQPFIFVDDYYGEGRGVDLVVPPGAPRSWPGGVTRYEPDCAAVDVRMYVADQGEEGKPGNDLNLTMGLTTTEDGSVTATMVDIRAHGVMPTPDEWLRLVDHHFGYLLDAGFRTEPVALDEALSFWITRVVAVAGDKAIEIDCSLEFDGVDIHLVRLIDGRFPLTDIWVTEHSVLNRFHLSGLVLIRAPELWPELRELRGLTAPFLERQLRAWAAALAEVGHDFLDGDFAPFVPLEARVMARVREDPPTLTVHVPIHTPDSRIREIIESHERDFPGVDIVISRYGEPKDEPS